MHGVPQDLTALRLESSQPGPNHFAWIPLPVLLAAEIGLWFNGTQTPYESPGLLIALNLPLATLPALIIAFLFARSFTSNGTPGIALSGCGALLWSVSGLSPLLAALAPSPWLNVNAFVMDVRLPPAQIFAMPTPALNARIRWSKKAS